MKLTKNKIEIHIIEQSKTILDSLFLYLKFSKLLIYVNFNKVQQWPTVMFNIRELCELTNGLFCLSCWELSFPEPMQPGHEII